MRKLPLVILKTLYDATGGRVGVSVDVVGRMADRNDALAREDVTPTLAALAARGFVTMRPDTWAALTAYGLRALWEGLASDARSDARLSLPAKTAGELAAEDANEELEIEEIKALVGYPEALAELAKNGPTGLPSSPPGSGPGFLRPSEPFSGQSPADVSLRADPPRSPVRLLGLRRELEGLTQSLVSSGTLSMPQWTRALELTRQIEQSIGTLESVLNATE